MGYLQVPPTAGRFARIGSRRALGLMAWLDLPGRSNGTVKINLNRPEGWGQGLTWPLGVALDKTGGRGQTRTSTWQANRAPKRCRREPGRTWRGSCVRWRKMPNHIVRIARQIKSEIIFVKDKG